MSTTYKRTKTSEEILEKIIQEINKNGGIVKREQLSSLGIDYRRILDYVRSGDLVRIKNGYYTNRMDRFSEEELIAKLFPDALLCMESALYVYGYILEKPYGWNLAVDKNTSKSRFHMDYPKVIPYYTEPESLLIGASHIEIAGYTFQIYDKERVICDCLKYENKMDRDTFKNAIQSYIRDTDKDISLLLEYAKERKVVKKVRSMMGVWL
jgi:predicted transcriptional regulator of viral defense system